MQSLTVIALLVVAFSQVFAERYPDYPTYGNNPYYDEPREVRSKRPRGKKETSWIPEEVPQNVEPYYVDERQEAPVPASKKLRVRKETPLEEPPEPKKPRVKSEKPSKYDYVEETKKSPRRQQPWVPENVPSYDYTESKKTPRRWVPENVPRTSFYDYVESKKPRRQQPSWANPEAEPKPVGEEKSTRDYYIDEKIKSRRQPKTEQLKKPKTPTLEEYPTNYYEKEWPAHYDWTNDRHDYNNYEQYNYPEKTVATEEVKKEETPIVKKPEPTKRDESVKKTEPTKRVEPTLPPPPPPKVELITEKPIPSVVAEALTKTLEKEPISKPTVVEVITPNQPKEEEKPKEEKEVPVTEAEKKEEDLRKGQLHHVITAKLAELGDEEDMLKVENRKISSRTHKKERRHHSSKSRKPTTNP